jgi:hypothetical protein
MSCAGLAVRGPAAFQASSRIRGRMTAIPGDQAGPAAAQPGDASVLEVAAAGTCRTPGWRAAGASRCRSGCRRRPSPAHPQATAPAARRMTTLRRALPGTARRSRRSRTRRPARRARGGDRAAQPPRRSPWPCARCAAGRLADEDAAQTGLGGGARPASWHSAELPGLRHMRPAQVLPPSLFEHPAAELSVDDSAQLYEDRRQPDHIA